MESKNKSIFKLKYLLEEPEQEQFKKQPEEAEINSKADQKIYPEVSPGTSPGEEVQDMSGEPMDSGETMDPNDPNAMMEPDPEEMKSDISNTYKLKTIFIKLNSIKSVLDKFADPKYDELRKKLIESIDVFGIIIDNYDVYKDDINDIIRKYEIFLKDVLQVFKSINPKEY